MIGAFQLGNTRTVEELRDWLDRYAAEEKARQDAGLPFGPLAVNINAGGLHRPGQREKIDLIEAARVPLIVSSTGDPTALAKRAHGWGARVIHDVTTIRHAEKAAACGVDGMMLTCTGAGGHTGALSPLAFLPQVRKFFDGALVLAGGIAEPAAAKAALALGADLVCMGTRFIASNESAAPQAYKEMLVTSTTADVVATDAIAGLTANWLAPSIVANGLDPENLPPPKGQRQPDLPEGIKAWKSVWSAGHTVGLIDDVAPVATIVDRFAHGMKDALAPGWQARLCDRLGCTEQEQT